jgi:hypothetical protein
MFTRVFLAVLALLNLWVSHVIRAAHPVLPAVNAAVVDHEVRRLIRSEKSSHDYLLPPNRHSAPAASPAQTHQGQPVAAAGAGVLVVAGATVAVLTVAGATVAAASAAATAVRRSTWREARVLPLALTRLQL